MNEKLIDDFRFNDAWIEEYIYFTDFKNKKTFTKKELIIYTSACMSRLRKFAESRHKIIMEEKGGISK